MGIDGTDTLHPAGGEDEPAALADADRERANSAAGPVALGG
jgi:hypothetical protein